MLITIESCSICDFPGVLDPFYPSRSANVSQKVSEHNQ